MATGKGGQQIIQKQQQVGDERDTCEVPGEMKQGLQNFEWDNVRASDRFLSSKVGQQNVSLDMSHIQFVPSNSDSQTNHTNHKHEIVNQQETENLQQTILETQIQEEIEQQVEAEETIDQQGQAENVSEESSTEKDSFKYDDFISEEDEINVGSDKAGAKILAANKEAKKIQKVIDSDLDTFMMNDCSAEKWVILELSQRAIVRRIAIAVTELYSSLVKDFQVYGRERHPRYDIKQGDYSNLINSSSWNLIGNFTAENRRGPQVFTVNSHPDLYHIPQWLLFKFQTHYGTEPVCALNDLKVYGLTEAQILENRLLHLDLNQASQQTIDEQSTSQQQLQQQQSQNEDGNSGGGDGQVVDEKEDVGESEQEQPVLISQFMQIDVENQTRCDVDKVIFGNISDTSMTCCNIDVCFPQDEMVEVRKSLPELQHNNSVHASNLNQNGDDQKQQQNEIYRTVESQQLFVNAPKPIPGHSQGSVYDRIINEMISLKLNQTYTWKQNQELQESINSMGKTIEILNTSLIQQVEQRQSEAVQSREKTMKLQQVTNQQSVQLAELSRHIERLESSIKNLTQVVDSQGQQGQLLLNISKILMGAVVGMCLAIFPRVEPKVIWLLFLVSVGIIGALIAMRMAQKEGWQIATIKAAVSCVNHCLVKRN
eukprot:TRINITY_DN13115_c0_g2_i4.p1 TRINITY_DN13115_c0_g2~~TRINITY_DN13115_c0_g2_i4.p1  ORF type:complete len:744 (-),score=101.81 TRINITY_DN13115_c0_g2_i4:886-2850(-)